MIDQSTAVLAAADVTKTVAFYAEVLGFKQHWLWGNPPTFGCIGLGKAELFLCQQPELAGNVDGHLHFFDAGAEVEALYEQHRASGAPIISPLENKPWGIREYTVRDLNGYHLRFSGPEKYERPPAAANALPSHVRIEVALPDLETYQRLYESVGWARDEPSMRQALANSMFGVRAIDARDGRAVGMARVTGDGRSYMIWDVIVSRPHQGQKIGQALIEAALAELRQRGPSGAFVGLFTGKPAFYERVGFKKDIGMHLAL